MKEKVICIVGPTASGKTGLGVALAKKLNGEVISADSMQIYKNLTVGTAKVTTEEAQGIVHHGIDICDIDQPFSVADFQKMCYDELDDIIKRKKVPIIVGGTGLYVSSVVDHMNFKEEKIDESYREMLYELAKTHSKEYVHQMLKEVDAKSAEEIHPNNLKRVIRALEIARNASQLKSQHLLEEESRKKEEDSIYDFHIFCLEFDRQKLYERINQRVDMMIDGGILQEAKFVYDKKLPKDATCMQAIGYKEFFPYFEGSCSLEDCIEKLKQETRKYAKRQMTWFKNKLNCYYLNAEQSKEEMIAEILTMIN